MTPGTRVTLNSPYGYMLRETAGGPDIRIENHTAGVVGDDGSVEFDSTPDVFFTVPEHWLELSDKSTQGEDNA